ncbi:MAG: YfiR family protein [Pseudomonadota bacterium]
MGVRLPRAFTWSLGLVFGLSLGVTTTLSAQAVDAAYQIKASYIYNFLQFVHFPSEALHGADTVNVCILGEDRFGPALDEIDGATTPQGHLKVMRLGRFPTRAVLDSCNVLYLIDSERQGVDSIMAKVNEAQILTIGEFSPFIRYGGLIELFEQQDMIRFRVNEALLSKIEFKIDAQLVQLGVK